MNGVIATAFVISCMAPAAIAMSWAGTPRGNTVGGAWVWGMCGMFPAVLAAFIAESLGADGIGIVMAAWAAWALPGWGIVAYAWRVQ